MRVQPCLIVVVEEREIEIVIAAVLLPDDLPDNGIERARDREDVTRFNAGSGENGFRPAFGICLQHHAESHIGRAEHKRSYERALELDPAQPRAL